jgi:spore coat protein U-like protein
MKTMLKKSKLSLAMIALCAAAGIGSTVALAADTATVAVSSAVKGNCKFTGGGTVGFVLDPGIAGDVTGTVTQPAFWCTKKSTYTITDNDGLHSVVAGARRMQHATDVLELIPYSFTYTTTGTGLGKGTPINMTIASTVLNADFINAAAGAYADTVTLSILP